MKKVSVPYEDILSLIRDKGRKYVSNVEFIGKDLELTSPVLPGKVTAHLGLARMLGNDLHVPISTGTLTSMALNGMLTTMPGVHLRSKVIIVDRPTLTEWLKAGGIAKGDLVEVSTDRDGATLTFTR